jgi:hypothetical protein
MKSSGKYFAVFLGIFCPAMIQAQSVGQVECPRSGDYVYLYSSMTTLDVRTTLQCGEQVQITGRYDLYFGVRTTKGEVGYVPADSLLLLKDKPGAKASLPKPVPTVRERISYDAPGSPTGAASSAPSNPSEFTLRNGTPIRLKLGKTISSATAHVGDAVDLLVAEDIPVDGLVVIPRGAAATGVVKEVEPRKRLGHGGKLGFSIDSVRLKDNEKAAVRSFQESSGTNNSAGGILPGSGKDVVFTQGTEFTAYVDGDVHLKKAAFQGERDSSSAMPATPDQKASPPLGF